MDFTGFILAHAEDDTARLLLDRKKYPGIDVDLAVNTIEARRRIRTKLPEWYGHEGIIYPTRLSPEQASSEETARYKARLFSRTVGKNGRIADLTGGLGADSRAFSAEAEKVLYNEMDPVLAEAARHNFGELGCRNITVTCHEAVPDGTPPGGNRATLPEILGDFSPDMIFMDPARRSGSGKKVFLIEDCRPDVTALLPEVFGLCRHFLLKLSPMADISMVCSRLPHVREVHVLGSGGECKELLLLLDREWTGNPEITVWDSGASFSFSQEMEKAAVPLISPFPPSEGDLLFEPGKALMKAGCFSLLSERFNLGKLDPSTHLYICPGTLPEPLPSLGRTYRILEVAPFGKKSVRDLGERFKGADVTAKNLPVSSEELRCRLAAAGKNKEKALPTGKSHIFGLRCAGKGILLVTERATT